MTINNMLTLLLSKRGQSALKGLNVTELLEPTTLCNPSLTDLDKRKLTAIKEAYQSYAVEQAVNQRDTITSTRTAGDIFTKLLINEPQEILAVAVLNTKNEILDIKKIFKGTLNSSVAHPREIFAYALEYRASRIIIAHNHPSGDTEPSKADLEFTKRMITCGELMGIECLDHIIVGREYLSLREYTNLW